MITKEQMEKCIPEIEKLAKHFGVQESNAVEAYGHLLSLHTANDRLLSFEDCLSIIKDTLKVPVDKLTYEEARIGLRLGLLKVKQKPFLSDKNLKASRNDPCPCNSGIKFKKCCLAEFKKHDY